MKPDLTWFHLFRMPMPEIVEDPRYEGLDEADRAKVGNNVSSNCIVFKSKLKDTFRKTQDLIKKYNFRMLLSHLYDVTGTAHG